MTTKLFDDIVAAELREQYDTQCKLLLSEKPILARIMKECVDEYKNYTVEQIENCIEGKPDISSVCVYPNGKIVKGQNTEDKSIAEGNVYYDIKFSATVPQTEGHIELIINVEAQNKYNPGYPLIKRGIYYASRLISSQFGSEIEKEDYAHIKKVYSIWICMNPPKSVRNTIVEFNIGQNIKVGSEKKEDIEKSFEKKDYDLMSIIFVNLDKQGAGASNLLELLTLIFHGEMKAIEKCKTLEAKFGLEMYQEISQEVANMCDLSYGVWEKGIEEGKLLGISQGISQGIAQGKKQKALETAHILKLSHIDTALIAKSTGLSEEEIALL